MMVCVVARVFYAASAFCTIRPLSGRVRLTSKMAVRSNVEAMSGSRNSLADAFRQPDAPRLVARSLSKSTMRVTELKGAANHGVTAPQPKEDAYLIALQLR